MMNQLERTIYSCLSSDMPHAKALKLSKSISSEISDKCMEPEDLETLLQEQKYACAETYMKRVPEVHYSRELYNHINSTPDVEIRLK